MPKDCESCSVAHPAECELWITAGYKQRHKDCPLVEVPTSHGRLIDADALPHYTGYALSASEVAKAVEAAPTIIEAEEGRQE